MAVETVRARRSISLSQYNLSTERKEQPLKKTARLIVLAVAVVCLCPRGFAHSPMDKAKGGDLQQLVDQSNLVFTGTAAQVAYRTVAGNEGEGGIPYTIVTYKIEQVLRGKAPGATITLRFVGGPDGRGRFLSVQGVPVVQEGDRDVLFIGNTQDSSCPLVFCEHGRYRILKDQVYDTYGSPVRDVSKAKILSRGAAPAELLTVRYPTPKFDDLLKNPEVQEQLRKENLSADAARARYEQEAPKSLELRESYGTTDKGQDSGDKAISVAEPERNVPVGLALFLSATAEVVKVSKRAPETVRSADATFRVAPLALTKPADLAPGKFSPASADAEEYRALELNGFNPVLKKGQ